MTDDVHIEPFRSEHAAGVAALWEREHLGLASTWLSRFHWQYECNPARQMAGDMGIVLLSSSDEVMGSKLWMPQKMRVRGSDRLVRVSTDTVVHPDFRRHSLKLIFKYFKECADPFAMSVSAGGKHARIWLARHGHVVPGAEQRHSVYLDPAGFLAARWRGRMGRLLANGVATAAGPILGAYFGTAWRRHGRGYTVQSVDPSDERLDDLWNKCRDEHDVTNVRDAAFREWRYQSWNSRLCLVSTPNGRPCLFAAYVPFPSQAGEAKRARILDLFGKTDSACAEALAAVLNFLHRSGFATSDFNGFSRRWHGHFRALGARSYPVDANMVYLQGKNAQPRLDSEIDWHVVPADGDSGFADLSPDASDSGCDEERIGKEAM